MKFNYRLITILLFAFNLSLPAQSSLYAQNSTAPEIINVIDFGATPNDTIDDTAAIQQALDSSSNPPWDTTLGTYYLSNKQVYFPTGVYLVTGLVINHAYTKIKGTGIYSSVLKLHDATGSVINLNGAAYVEIEQMGIDGAGTASYGIYADDVGYVPERKGDFASVHGLLNGVRISGANGTPGIGFANADRAHSWRIIDSASFLLEALPTQPKEYF